MPEETINPLDGNSRSILQLKVRLIDISPMVWRRVLVPATMTLKDLHGVLGPSDREAVRFGHLSI